MTIAIIVVAGLLVMTAIGGLTVLMDRHAELWATKRARSQEEALIITCLAGQVYYLAMALEREQEENEYLRVNLERTQGRYDALVSAMAEGLSQKEARG